MKDKTFRYLGWTAIVVFTVLMALYTVRSERAWCRHALYGPA